MKTLLNNLDLTSEPTPTGRYRNGLREYQVELVYPITSASQTYSYSTTATEALIDYGRSYVDTGQSKLPVNFPYGSDRNDLYMGVVTGSTVTIIRDTTTWYGSAYHLHCVLFLYFSE